MLPNLLLILICLSAGGLAQRSGLLPEGSHKSVNLWIIYIAFPAVALKFVPSLSWRPELLLPMLTPLLVWLGAWLFLRFFPPARRLEPATRAALLLTAGLGNTSFVGFPLTQAYYGDEGLAIAVVCDQFCFLTLSTLGVFSALRASSPGGNMLRIIGWRVLSFPPFIAFVAALLLPRLMDLSALDPLFEKLSVTLVPLALFSVGLQLRFGAWQREWVPLAIGLGYKLVLAPALVWGVALCLSLQGLAAQVSIFEASMAPMVTASILAADYGLHPRLASLMVGIGIPLSLLSSALWWWALGA